MKSFRTEIENPVVEKDILELARKIELFKNGKINEERFRSVRLARGVYGQRQPGVQMIRIKLPYGKISSQQLHRIAEVSDTYSNGILHITTRQDIQIHYVSLDRTPELWAELEKDNITLREACGNTVRNVTASESAGIDPKEPFDVSPYAHAVFEYFLRNPVCQELGRKFKISFSATEEDTALSFLHDLGFIPKIRNENGRLIRGFKVMLAGGLGAQPRHADVAHEFLEADQVIPFIEGVLRVFDREGERSKRARARIKFLLEDLGLETFLKLVKEEQTALANKSYPIDTSAFEQELILPETDIKKIVLSDPGAYALWKETNVSAQKQKGRYAVGIRVPLGNFDSSKARSLADLALHYAGNEMRLTLRQNIQLRHVKEELLPFIYQELKAMGFAGPGYNSTRDITACPGTDTCNLGIASSTGIARELERVLESEFPQYAGNKALTIKISGCMNACGQHSMAQIGFQGMSVKSGKLVAPALQVLLGGGVLGNGKGRFADKVVKIPSKRGPEALRILLTDFEKNAEKNENFLNYYDRKTEKYFYQMLKHLSDTNELKEADFIDWGYNKSYVTAIGVGECAGVVIDLVATLLFESEEKIQNAENAIESERWADSIYHAYASMINTAKAVLIDAEIKTNTQTGIVTDFDREFVEKGIIPLVTSFSSLVNQIRTNEPTSEFAKKYLADARSFYQTIYNLRSKELSHEVGKTA